MEAVHYSASWKQVILNAHAGKDREPVGGINYTSSLSVILTM